MPPSRRSWPWILPAVVTGIVYATTAGLPYFSETWSHTVAARGIEGVGDLFDPARIPFRPFQHAWFWGMEELWPVPSAIARVPGFLAHLVSCALVAALARRLGAGDGAAVLAALGFAVFPNVKSLVYVAAVGWPFRVMATLVGLNALLAHAERPRARTGVVVLAGFLFGLSCNEGAVVLPVLGGLLLWGRRGRSALRLLEDPWLLACIVLAGASVIWIGFLQERTIHLAEGGALLANGARAALCLAPEDLRVPVVEALRAGGARQLVGLSALGLLGVVAGAWLLRASAVVRALVASVPVEWAPALAVSGFVQRYAYLASALLAIALVLTWQRARGAKRLAFGVAGVFLFCAWSFDTAVDVAELRGAGRAVESVLEAAAEARARAAAGESVTLLDPPQVSGTENDLLVLDYGVLEALELRGAEGPWRVLATVGPWWRPSVVAESRAEILERLRRSGGTYVAFDPRTGEVQEAR